MSDSDVETGLFGFVFDVDLTGALVVQQRLAENQFEVVFVHVIGRARYLFIAHIRKVEGCAVAMATLRDGVDVSASL